MDDQKKPYTVADKRDRADAVREGQSPGGSPSGGDETPSAAGQQKIQAIDFSTLIMSFASAAMISLGRMPDHVTGQISRNIPLAQQNIGIISLLKEKTKGNLTKEEETLLDGILYELHTNYIDSLKG